MISALRLMLKNFHASRVRLTRLLLPVLVVSILVLTSGCGLFGAKRKIEVPQLLTPLAEANKDRLIQEINRLSTVVCFVGYRGSVPVG
jgi:hypothetical protein